MSVLFSGTLSGSFTSNGQNYFLPLRTGVDWLWVYNESVEAAAGAGAGAQFYWRNGMNAGAGIQYVKEATIGALVPGNVAANAGFFFQDTTISNPGALVTITAVSGGTPPVVSTANTAGLIPNSSIVRLYNVTGANEITTMDFTIGTVTTNTSFTLAYGPTVAAAAAPGANAGYRIIPFLPYFYPSYRFITNISQAAQAIVTLSVTHSYTVGQKIRLTIPTVTSSAFGMTALNEVEATIVAVNQADANGYTNTITIDQNTSAMTAFHYPLTTDPGFSPSMVTPVGENTAVALSNNLNIIADATYNTGQIGMLLIAGANSPAGVNGNVISYIAGKSFNQ